MYIDCSYYSCFKYFAVKDGLGRKFSNFEPPLYFSSAKIDLFFNSKMNLCSILLQHLDHQQFSLYPVATYSKSSIQNTFNDILDVQLRLSVHIAMVFKIIFWISSGFDAELFYVRNGQKNSDAIQHELLLAEHVQRVKFQWEDTRVN